MQVLEISNDQIREMIAGISGHFKSDILTKDVIVQKSDNFGPSNYRIWTVLIQSTGTNVVGVIERWHGGLRLMCSVYGGPARTYYFTEKGVSINYKKLRETTPIKPKQMEERNG